MSSSDYLRQFITTRLTDAAEEIFGVFKNIIVEYEEELDRQRRLMEDSREHEIKLHTIELPLHNFCKEEEVLSEQQHCNQDRNSSEEQEDSEAPQTKEEQNELCISQEGEQLEVKQETEAFMFIGTDEDFNHIEEKADEILMAAQEESAVNMPVIISVIDIYCCFCGNILENSPKFCRCCGRDVSKIIEAAITVCRSSGEDGSLQIVSNVTDACATPLTSAVNQFTKHSKLKEMERKTFLKTKRKSQKVVKISVGIMSRSKHGFKPIRGKTQTLYVDPQWSPRQLLVAATKKLKEYNQDMEDGQFVLLYPDGSEVKNIPGTNTRFTIERYKEAIGKAYQRVTLYICILEDFLSKSDADDLITEDEDDDEAMTSPEISTPECRHCDGLTAADVVSYLSQRCNRFNINQANVWNGALRGFKRSTYDPTRGKMETFTDDVG